MLASNSRTVTNSPNQRMSEALATLIDLSRHICIFSTQLDQSVLPLILLGYCTCERGFAHCPLAAVWVFDGRVRDEHDVVVRQGRARLAEQAIAASWNRRLHGIARDPEIPINRMLLQRSKQKNHCCSMLSSSVAASRRLLIRLLKCSSLEEN